MIPVPGTGQESNIIKLRGEVSKVFEVLREIGGHELYEVAASFCRCDQVLLTSLIKRGGVN